MSQVSRKEKHQQIMEKAAGTVSHRASLLGIYSKINGEPLVLCRGLHDLFNIFQRLLWEWMGVRQKWEDWPVGYYHFQARDNGKPVKSILNILYLHNPLNTLHNRNFCSQDITLQIWNSKELLLCRFYPLIFTILEIKTE